MSLITAIRLFIDRRRHGGKPYGEKYAIDLRRQLSKIWTEYLDKPVGERELHDMSVLSTVREVSLALIERRVTIDQLKPEIQDFDDTMRWLWHESEIGRLSWSDPVVRDALSLGCVVLSRDTFYELMRSERRRQAAVAWNNRQC